MKLDILFSLCIIGSFAFWVGHMIYRAFVDTASVRKFKQEADAVIEQCTFWANEAKRLEAAAMHASRAGEVQRALELVEQYSTAVHRFQMEKKRFLETPELTL